MLMTVKGYGYHRYHEHGDENTVSSSRPPLRTAQQALQTISVETALNEVHALHIMNNICYKPDTSGQKVGYIPDY